MKSTSRAIAEWAFFLTAIALAIYGIGMWIPKNIFKKPKLDLALIEYVNDVPEGCAWKAVSTCDYQILMECLTNEDLTLTDDEGRTLLHYSVTTPMWQKSEATCLASVIYLNIKGIPLDRKDNRGLTSLHYASMAGNNLAVIYLHEKDNDLINEKDNLDFTPLKYAETYAQLGGEQYTNVITYLKGVEGYGVFIPATIDSYIYWIEGTVYSDMGEFDNAISRFGESITNCGDDTSCLLDVGWRSYWMRGMVYHELGRYNDAIADFSSAIDLHPEEVNLIYNRGRSYYYLGECESAKADLGQYIGAVLSHIKIGEIITDERFMGFSSAQSMIKTCIDAP